MVDPDTMLINHSLGPPIWPAVRGATVDLVMSANPYCIFITCASDYHTRNVARAMGFLLFNNVAIAAYQDMNFHNLKRVAIIDLIFHQETWYR